MADKMNEEILASSTLHLLEARLHRLTYLLTGNTTWTGTPIPPQKPASHEETVSQRLQNLENELARLSRSVSVVRDVLVLYNRFPDLFKTPLLSSSTQTQPLKETGLNTSTPNSQVALATVLSHQTAFPETASRLTSLNDLPIPDASLSASLIELMPRLEKLASLQDEQSREISELRVRTAKVLSRWYEVSVLGGGECWGEWEGRLEGVERGVRRTEILREREGEI